MNSDLSSSLGVFLSFRNVLPISKSLFQSSYLKRSDHRFWWNSQTENNRRLRIRPEYFGGHSSVRFVRRHFLRKAFKILTVLEKGSRRAESPETTLSTTPSPGVFRVTAVKRTWVIRAIPAGNSPLCDVRRLVFDVMDTSQRCLQVR